jgi:hypothetical protein
MTITATHTTACFDAWIKCENLLSSLAEVQHSVSKQITKVVDECALICMGTFHAMKSRSMNINKFALLCVGICEECAEICEQQNTEGFLECARICRECSRSMSNLAFNEDIIG